MMFSSSVTQIFLVFFALICVPQVVTSHSSFPIVLVISMDAFRYDYIDRCDTPNIDKLRSRGAYAAYLNNVFPTKTFPNHHSIATGFHPDVHGVIDNSVYIAKDRCGNKSVIGYSYELFHANDEVIPLWTLNEMAGHGRHSGVMMWPGGEFPYGERQVRPQFWEKAAFNVSFEKRIDRVIDWLTHPLTPANLVFMYFEEPDLHGHAYGTNSPSVRAQIRRLDLAMAYLDEKLKSRKLDSIVNVCLVSDHGMITFDQENIIDLDEFVDKDLYIAASTSPAVQIFPKAGAEDEVLSGLAAARNASKNAFDFYKREKIPPRWCYAGSSRAPPILAVANKGYAFQDVRETIVNLDARFGIKPNLSHEYGMHGYDNMFLSMKSMFAMWGPDIRPVGLLASFDTVELYPTWASILRLRLPKRAGRYRLPVIQMLYFDPKPKSRVGRLTFRASALHFDASMPIAFVVGYLTWIIVIVMSFSAATVFVLYLRHHRSSPLTKCYHNNPRLMKHDIEAQRLLPSSDCEKS